MKVLTAIAIVVTAVLGCSYVGSTHAATCKDEAAALRKMADMGLVNGLVVNGDIENTMLKACTLGMKAKATGLTPEEFEGVRGEVLEAVYSPDIDPAISAELISWTSNNLDVGFFGHVQERK